MLGQKQKRYLSEYWLEQIRINKKMNPQLGARPDERYMRIQAIGLLAQTNKSRLRGPHNFAEGIELPAKCLWLRFQL